MRSLVPAMMISALCVGASAPALAQLEGANTLGDMVHALNAKIGEARAERERTGDYAAYKATVDPLVNSLQSVRPSAMSPGSEATDAIIRGMEESRQRNER